MTSSRPAPPLSRSSVRERPLALQDELQGVDDELVPDAATLSAIAAVLVAIARLLRQLERAWRRARSAPRPPGAVASRVPTAGG